MEPVIYRRLGQSAIFIGPAANSTSAGNSLFILPSTAAGSAPAQREFCPGKGAQQALGAAEPRPSRCFSMAGTNKSVENQATARSACIPWCPLYRPRYPLGQRLEECLEEVGLPPRWCPASLHQIWWSKVLQCTQWSISQHLTRNPSTAWRETWAFIKDLTGTTVKSVVPRGTSVPRPAPKHRLDGRFESQLYPSGPKTLRTCSTRGLSKAQSCAKTQGEGSL